MSKWTKSKTIKNFYKHYKYRKDKQNSFYLDKKQWVNTIELYLQEVLECILTGKKYVIPHTLGVFAVRKFQPKEKPRNFNLEKKVFKETGKWKKIVYNNFHSDNFLFTIVWYKHRNVPNCYYINFKTSRAANKLLNKSILSYKTRVDNIQTNHKKFKLNQTKTLV